MNLKKENILVVDDNLDMLDFVQRLLKSFNYHTYKASSVNEAIDILKYSTIDLLISDLNMPNINGIELLKYTDEHFPEMPKLVISGLPSIPNVVSAMQSGAMDYLTKPFTSQELHDAILNSFDKTKILKSDHNLQNLKADNVYENLVGRSDHYKNTITIIERVKNNKATVLIEGESGTGKELIARAIHAAGSFAAKSFIAVNCGAISENLIESELFGSTKGSYTGATENRIGLFQAASGGTIFLDEIGNAPLSVQSKLLRVIQEKEILRIGAVKPEKIDVRIICATNNDLQKMITKGDFREDLYYRINVVNIKTTPLRDRKEDLPILIDTFLKKYALEYNRSDVSIQEKAMEILMRYHWPGNIRELENTIQRMIIMSDDIITLNHIPENLKYQIPEDNYIFKSLKEFEREQILKVLHLVNNNKTKAAQILQIDRKTLNQKIL